MTKIYGISNCDTVSKAKKWLAEAGIDYAFIDFRKDGLTSEQVAIWAQAVGIDLLLNRRGTTWRKLSEDQKSLFTEGTEAELIDLMTEYPALIKRPVLETKDRIEVGFKSDFYQNIFSL